MDNNYNEEEYNKLISKYNYKEMIHDAFKQVITPEFKKRGFKKKGKTFYRERDGIIEICEVQYSRGNHQTTAKFTYNISIAIPSLYSELGIEVKNKLETTICGIRIGDVIGVIYDLPSYRDYWYSLEAYSVEKSNYEGLSEEDIKVHSFYNDLDTRYDIKTGEGFGEVLIHDIENVIIPFFLSISDAKSLIEHLSNDEPKGEIDEQMMFQLGHKYYDHGKKEKGREIISRIRYGNYRNQIEYKIQNGKIVL